MSDLQLVNTVEPVEEKPVVDTAKLEEATKVFEVAKAKLEAMYEKMQKKEYLVEGGIESAKELDKWLRNDVTWNFSECVAVTKLIDEDVADAINNIQTGKTKELYLGAMSLNAVSYLMQKQNGVGYDSAKKFEKVAKPIIDTLNNSVKVDDEQLKTYGEYVKRLEYIAGAATEGIDTDPGVMNGIDTDKINEIENETE